MIFQNLLASASTLVLALIQLGSMDMVGSSEGMKVHPVDMSPSIVYVEKDGTKGIIYPEDWDDNDAQYDIVSGNGTQLFSIDRVSGIVSVKSSLSGHKNKEYQVVVKAEDKGLAPLSSTVPVNLVVTDVNVHAPVFIAPVSRQITIPESKKVGTLIETFRAEDSDYGLNAEIEFFITAGNDDDLFSMNKASGDLSVKNELDYEVETDYQLTVTAKDKALHPKDKSITYLVKLQDVNDNDPVFGRSSDTVFIEENSPRGVSVYQALAVDADSGENAVIQYAIVEGNGQNKFLIDSSTGLVTTSGDLDYETEEKYTLMIMASNNAPGHKSTMTLNIAIDGVNEYVPRFTKDVYYFSVSESADVSTPIGRVRAEDNDAGPDGIVNYFLIGDSNAKGFKVDPRTGDILVSGQPDYESSPKITLRVLAKNWGSVRGNDTDICEVQINVQDANDPPKFSQNIYQAYIREDTTRADVSVVKVQAVDSDFDAADKTFTYTILAGNVKNMFKIGPSTGIVTTTGNIALDRETVAVYNVTVGAVDTGSPPETGSATVSINIEDVNDNGPFFTNFTASVREGQAPGTMVTTLTQFTDDLDGTGNKGPYSYSNKPGSHIAYQFFTIESNGVVKTKAVLDRESANSEFAVPVVVSDSGQPRQTSTLTFKVIILDENDSPPKPRYLDIYLSVYEGQLPSGPIANIRPLDDDSTGSYSCSLAGANNPFMFSIVDGCNLKMSQIPSDPEYTISVESTDGIHESVTYDVVVKVSTFGNTTLEHSTVIQIADTTPENFIQHLYSDFLSALKIVFEPQDKINIFGLSGHSSGVLVNIAASYGIDEYFKKSELVQKLSSGKSRIEKDIGKYIASLDFSGCQESQCKNSGQCASHVTVQGTNQIADSPYQVFSSPTLKLTTYCVCQPEYTGPDCSQQATPCGNIYCQNGATCVTNGNVPTCSCPETWTGNRCDQDINECASPGFGKNGGTCQNTLGGFTCECVDGYFGKQCQDGENFCKTSPCVHGTCENQPEGYVCLCNYGYFGLTCDKSSIGFFETSYMEYPAVTSLSSMEIVFATEKANALVMYNPSQASSKFLAVQILKGQLEVAANVGSGSTVRLSVSTLVNTGKWFQARIVVNSQTVRVWVDRCPENLVGCEECQTGSNCYNQTHIPGQWSLGRNDHPLLIGGVKNMDTILDRLGQVSSHDFIGCMQTVTINDVELLGETSLSDAGIERACPRSEAGDVCAGYTCANGGACVSEWTGAVCHCTPGFMGTHCEEALKPIGFSPATYISIKMRETARRDALLVDGSRRRRATTSSSLMLRFRTTQTNGMLMFASAEGNRFCVLSVFDGSVKFTVTQYGGSKSVITPNINVSDGEWHNVTVSLNGKDATLSLDGTQSQTSALDPFLFNYPKVQNFTIGGAPSTVTIDNQNFKDFQGCISVFKLDGEQLPMIGETEKYKIVATAGYENGCSDMCTNNVCNGNGCTIEGEAIVCAPPPGGGPALSIGIIIMIVFFVVLLIVIVIVFIVFRKRGQQCLKRKQLSAGAPAKSANSSGHSNPDSGYGENNIDELIIRNHVAQELAHSNYSRQLNGHLVKPDIIKSEVNRTAMPLEMEDGTVIIDNASDVTHLRDLNGEVLEHYDIENASSIAPSDIDVVDHYRHFHDGKQRRKNKAHSDHSQSKHSSRHYNNNSNHSNHSYHSHGMRDSPNLVSSVPFMNDLARNSPSARHSPMMNQLSRNSPNVQPSPLTVNIHGHHMPVTDLNGGSRTTSEHSLASHRSKTSNSTPNKPKRQMLPNGNLNSNKVLNHNYENGKFLTKEEVDRLNARPRESPASLMEAFSTSSENNTRKMQKPFEQYQDTSVLLEPPDSSSDDSANDSFTCSEFEYENDKPRNDFDPTNRIFSKIKEETEHEDGAYHNKNFKVDGLDSGGNSFSSNERSSDDNQGQSKAINSAFNWDDLLNWGPKFEKLVGVFTDIALLPDAENVDFAEAEAKSVDREEYV